MKTVTTALQTHLDGEVTTVTTIWTITRKDGEVIRLTELDRDITIGSNTWAATFGYTRTAISVREGFDPDEVDLTGLADGSYVSVDDLNAGLYDGATLLIELVNYEAPGDGAVVLRLGTLGEVIVARDRYSAQLASLVSKFSQEIVEKYSATCRAELGDSRCKIPLLPASRQSSTAYSVGEFVRVATTTGTGDQVYENRIYECMTAGTSASSAPTFDTSPGATTTDGTVVWAAREAWVRSAVVASVSNQRVFTVTVTESRAADDWFNLGTVVFQSGLNTDGVHEVKDWQQSGSQVSLFLPAKKLIQVGDVVSLRPGCDKLRETCRDKFAFTSTNFTTGNVLNFRGEPDLPGQDAVLTYPDAQ